MVEIETNTVPVESRTLPAGWTDFIDPMFLGPKKYSTKYPIKIMFAALLLT
jgi:hypothetical protein